MTTEEFSKTGFGAGDMAKYQNGIYPIAQIDFEEQLFGIIMNIPGSLLFPNPLKQQSSRLIRAEKKKQIIKNK